MAGQWEVLVGTEHLWDMECLWEDLEDMVDLCRDRAATVDLWEAEWAATQVIMPNVVHTLISSRRCANVSWRQDIVILANGVDSHMGSMT